MWPNNLFSSGKFRDTKEFKEFIKKTDKTTIKFRFDEVVKSISELLSNKSPSEIAQLQEMFRDQMVKYSLLSSFVHAGPTAVLDLGTKPKKKDIEMFSKLLTIIAYRNTILLLLQYPSEQQDELKKLYEKIHTNSEKAIIIYEEYCKQMEDSK